MPKKFETVFFWFDGAFTETVSSLVLKILRPDLSGAARVTLQEKIQFIQDDLSVGKLTSDEFCQKAVELCQVNLTVDHLESEIIHQANLNKPLHDIYTHVVSDNDTRVIVDLPETWFHSLIKRWQLENSFPANRLIFTTPFKLNRMLPDIAYSIPKAAGRNIDECILIDPRQMRAVALHKLGLVSTAFVYPRRLKIDLALQGIWKTDEDIYHPKAGARTNI
ncbi:hypothetical protein [Leptolinea tardivitalis]|uniref:Uncharacterized protein n=1 Tax=Leptolinea tardivitalis TaxID=229920 RepID=A0A0P6XTG3_9CHLR|nr:hypothetical protein [Leptolinea tardivitalis]KPL72761.1 hypothetical protein ADM99_06700 [Leptolinea tardivitalis]GAP20889.1 hypothetical protein LTAR_01090 [Leptolinea tardivitalis]